IQMARQHRINGIGRLRSASALRPEGADLPLLMDAAGNGVTMAMARRHILRPCATVGVAALGASLIAATPVVEPLLEADRLVATDVALTAGGALGLLEPWQDVFNTASANITQLLQNYYLAPGV